MGNDTKVSRKGKDEESNDIKGRNILRSRPPPPPTIPSVTRKSERLVEKQSLPTPSRRPEKGKNQSSSSSSGSTKCGTSGAPVHKMSQVMPSSSGPLNTTDANHVSNFSHLTSKLSQVLKADMVGYDGGRNLHDDSEKSLHLFLKPEIAKLCEILQLPVCISSLGRS
ncbi:hypothetical protein NC651_012258 [Populus alba x Populus x berolinensis]|nr:hypothetical protein NC651_012258 [Populus alba x Populus x berolinensis]